MLQFLSENEKSSLETEFVQVTANLKQQVKAHKQHHVDVGREIDDWRSATRSLYFKQCELIQGVDAMYNTLISTWQKTSHHEEVTIKDVFQLDRSKLVVGMVKQFNKLSEIVSTRTPLEIPEFPTLDAARQALQENKDEDDEPRPKRTLGGNKRHKNITSSITLPETSSAFPTSAPPNTGTRFVTFLDHQVTILGGFCYLSRSVRGFS